MVDYTNVTPIMIYNNFNVEKFTNYSKMNQERYKLL